MKRARLKRGASSMKRNRLTSEKSKITEILDFQSGLFESWDLKKLQLDAIKKKFEVENKSYLSKHYQDMVNENIPVRANYSRILQSIRDDFGSVWNYAVLRDYKNIGMSHHDAVLKDNKIQKMMDYRGVFVTIPIDMFYNYVNAILKDEILSDLSKVHEFTEKQKEQYYSTDGIVKTDLFTMERFKNGRVDVTFNDEASANKVMDAMKKHDISYRKMRDKVDD